MKVQLMLTCLCDAFYGEVGIAAVKVLRAAGCEVVFPEAQTCCGQPPFNAGDWKAARRIAEHCLSVFDPAIPIVSPSGSCTAMVREGYHQLGVPSVLQCFEVGEFLVKFGISSVEFGTRSSESAECEVRSAEEFLGDGRDGREVGTSAIQNPKSEISDEAALRPPPSEAPKLQTPNSKLLRVAFHRACHGRGLGLTDEQERLVGALPHVELVSFGQPEQCCGFGGAFAATHGKLSSGIGKEKLRNVVEAGAEVLVSGDMGCLMHLNGLIQREGLPLRTLHYLQLLAEALPE